MEIKEMWLPSYKYLTKSPKKTNKTTITIHNTGNSASAKNEATYLTKASNLSTTSYHEVVDDREVIKCIPWERMAHHCGNRNGNESSYSIEIAYSTHPNTDLFKKAEINASKRVAELLHWQGWGVDRLRTHQFWNGKYCPHKTLDWGWDRFVKMVQDELNKLNNSNKTTTNTNNKSEFTKKGDYEMRIWKNGSTKEVVYQDSRCTKSIGYLDPFENAYCVGELDGVYMVWYSLNGTWNGRSNNNKIGFVKYKG